MRSNLNLKNSINGSATMAQRLRLQAENIETNAHYCICLGAAASICFGGAAQGARI
jgi:hypothetical protein